MPEIDDAYSDLGITWKPQQFPFPIKFDSEQFCDIEGLSEPFIVPLPIWITNALAPAARARTFGRARAAETDDAQKDFAIALIPPGNRWFRISIVNPTTSWSYTSKDLGLVEPGKSVIFIFDPRRLKPTLTAGEYDEQLTVHLAAYRDPDYTMLLAEIDLPTLIHFYNSLDPAWTIIARDNFDDGTVQGWVGRAAGAVDALAPFCTEVHVAAEHWVSPPYSLSMSGQAVHPNVHAEKSYNAVGRTKARLTLHLYREVGIHGTCALAILLRRYTESNLILPAALSMALEANRWHRLAFNFPTDVATAIWIGTACTAGLSLNWFDEIRIVAK